MARLIGRLDWFEPPATAAQAQAAGISAWLMPVRWSPSAGLELAAPIESLDGLPFALEWQFPEGLSPMQEWHAALAMRQLVMHPEALRLDGRPLLWIHAPEQLSSLAFCARRLRLLVDQDLLLLVAGPPECEEIEAAYERSDRIPVQQLADGSANYESYLFHAHHRQVGSCRWLVPCVPPPGADGFSGATPGRYHECLALSEAWADLRCPSKNEQALVLVEHWQGHWRNRTEATSPEAGIVAAPLVANPMPPRACSWGEPNSSQGALLIHGYYLDLLERWLEPLANTRPAMDLYVSCRIGQLDQARGFLLRQNWPRVVLVEVENRGRDIAPFLSELLPRAVHVGHPWIVKLHTKRSLQTPGGAAWGEHLWYSLASTASLRLLELVFNQPISPVLVAPAGSLLPMSVCLARNSERLLHLCHAAHLDSRWVLEQRFVAGSMWAAKTAEASRLLNVTAPLSAFEQELGQADGTLAHAFERLITPLISAGDGILELEGNQAACPAFGHPWAAPSSKSGNTSSLPI